MFDIASPWPINASMDPPSWPQDRMLHSIRYPMEEEGMYRHSLIAIVLVPSDASMDKLFCWREQKMRIAWTIKALPSLSGKDKWTTQDHFSTLLTGSIPESGAAFFDDLLRYVMGTWLELCDSIDSHLTHSVCLAQFKFDIKVQFVNIHADNFSASRCASCEWSRPYSHHLSSGRC
jgi:thiol-disulfide isomerase/thioredoxin